MNITDDMVERAAKAMWFTSFAPILYPKEAWDKTWDDPKNPLMQPPEKRSKNDDGDAIYTKEDYRKIARNILEAALNN